MNITEKINTNLSNLTKSEKLVANYILKNKKDVELYTIIKLAELANVSKSAVLRFCQKLGYQGYSEFRYDMLNYLHQKKKTTLTLKNPIFKSLDLFKKSVEQLESIDTSLLERIVASILHSNQIYCIGIYKSSVIAKKFAYNLLNHGKEVFVLKDMVEVSHLPFHMKDNATVIIFSVSGTSAQLNSFLKLNSQLKNQTYLITSSKRSSTSKLVKETLILPANGLQEELLDPHAIHIIIVELLTEIYVRMSNFDT